MAEWSRWWSFATLKPLGRHCQAPSESLVGHRTIPDATSRPYAYMYITVGTCPRRVHGDETTTMMMLDEFGHAMRAEGGGGAGGAGHAGATKPRTPKHQDVKERQHHN
jgi:hypothetical protein